MNNPTKHLAGHLNKPLSENGSNVIAVRIPKEWLPAIDAKRGTQTRSEYLRSLLIKATQ